jgi:hypothetical protein
VSDDQDTEGESMRWSNKDLKKDIKPVEPKAAEDTEGHTYKGWSSRDLKKDIKPIEPEKA